MSETFDQVVRGFDTVKNYCKTFHRKKKRLTLRLAVNEICGSCGRRRTSGVPRSKDQRKTTEGSIAL